MSRQFVFGSGAGQGEGARGDTITLGTFKGIPVTDKPQAWAGCDSAFHRLRYAVTVVEYKEKDGGDWEKAIRATWQESFDGPLPAVGAKTKDAERFFNTVRSGIKRLLNKENYAKNTKVIADKIAELEQARREMIDRMSASDAKAEKHEKDISEIIAYEDQEFTRINGQLDVSKTQYETLKAQFVAEREAQKAENEALKAQFAALQPLLDYVAQVGSRFREMPSLPPSPVPSPVLPRRAGGRVEVPPLSPSPLLGPSATVFCKALDAVHKEDDTAMDCQ